MTEEQVVNLIEQVLDRRLARRDDVEGEYLTQSAAAKLADCSPSTIRSWCREGKLKRHHNGRVKRAALVRFMETGLPEVEEVVQAAERSPSNVVDPKTFAAALLAKRSGK